MTSNERFLFAVKITSGCTLTIGMLLFLLGLLENDYKIFTSIGLGTVIGGGLIFLLGVLFVATEEIVDKTDKGSKDNSKVISLKKKRKQKKKEKSAMADAPNSVIHNPKSCKVVYLKR